MIPFDQEIEQARASDPDFRRRWDECELGRRELTSREKSHLASAG